MVSNGEIYHLAFNISDELLRKGFQPSRVAIRDHLKELNKQDLPREEMEKRAKEWAIETYTKKS